MKKLITILIFASFALAASAQGLFKPVSPSLFSQDKYVLKAESGATQSAWLLRLQVGLEGVSYQIKKNVTPIPLDAICYGVGYLHYKNAEGLPFNDFGFNLLLLQNTQSQGMGLGVYGTYNTGLANNLGLLNLGFHYDFNLKGIFIDTGLTFHF